MTALDDFKTLAADRLRLVELLMEKEEWWLSAYMMGFVLECVLKAGACKSLNLKVYPKKTERKGKIANYFLTHDFDMLLIISGASDIFGNIYSKGIAVWSGFIQEFPDQYTSIRYETNSRYNESNVKRMYNFLTREPDGIIPLMTSEKKW